MDWNLAQTFSLLHEMLLSQCSQLTEIVFTEDEEESGFVYTELREGVGGRIVVRFDQFNPEAEEVLEDFEAIEDALRTEFGCSICIETGAL